MVVTRTHVHSWLCLQFTHGFPHPLPAWVAAGTENVNGYLRVTASQDALKVEAIGLKQQQHQQQPTEDGKFGSSNRSSRGKAPEEVQVSSWVMDCVTLLAPGASLPAKS